MAHGLENNQEYQEWKARQDAQDAAQAAGIDPILAKLKAMASENAKFTIWKSGDLGFGWSKKGRLEKVAVSDYAQYRNALMLEFRPYRKHKSVRVWVLPYQDCFLWDGWIDVDTNIWGAAKKGVSGMTFQSARHMAHSGEWATDARASVEQEPFYAQRARRD